MNKDSAGITNQSTPSAKSATLAVSLVSLYNQNNESILTIGKDTIVTPHNKKRYAEYYLQKEKEHNA